jgi:predicted RNA binding protein YcfA (HicA-like mRNA interferase family)
MPKLPNRSSKQVIKVLLAHGYVLDHVTLSHHAYIHTMYDCRVVVPFHTQSLPAVTLHSIIRQSGLKRENF